MFFKDLPHGMGLYACHFEALAEKSLLVLKGRCFAYAQHDKEKSNKNITILKPIFWITPKHNTLTQLL